MAVAGKGNEFRQQVRRCCRLLDALKAQLGEAAPSAGEALSSIDSADRWLRLVVGFFVSRAKAHLVAVQRLADALGDTVASQVRIIARSAIEDAVNLATICAPAAEIERAARAVRFLSFECRRRVKWTKDLIGRSPEEQQLLRRTPLTSGMTSSELNADRKRRTEDYERIRACAPWADLPEWSETNPVDWDGSKLGERAIAADRELRERDSTKGFGLFSIVSLLYDFLSNDVHGNVLALSYESSGRERRADPINIPTEAHRWGLLLLSNASFTAELAAEVDGDSTARDEATALRASLRSFFDASVPT